MKLLIFGASGRTGRFIMQNLLRKGHTVTAFVRTLKSLEVKNKNLRIVQGNITHEDEVAPVMKGQDAVISALGNKEYAIWHKNTNISEGLENILLTMKKQQVKRLIFVSSFGVSKHIFWPEKLFIKLVLKNIFADIPRQESLIEKSGLNWTIVRPARLADGKFTGQYKAGETLFIWPWSYISRNDVADFVVSCLENKQWISKKVIVRY